MNDQNLISICYSSIACPDFRSDELSRILVSSIRNNDKSDLSGVLTLSGKCFFQILEGPAEKIDKTFNRIVQDPRHKDVVVHYRESITERVFDRWSMGFCDASADGLFLSAMSDIEGERQDSSAVAASVKRVVDKLTSQYAAEAVPG